MLCTASFRLLGGTSSCKIDIRLYHSNFISIITHPFKVDKIHHTQGAQYPPPYPDRQPYQHHIHPISLTPKAPLTPVKRLMTPPHNLPERIRILRVPVPTHRSVLGDGVHEANLARHRDVSVLVDPAAPVAVEIGRAHV